MYNNFNQLVNDIEQYHPVYCSESVGNVIGCCRCIQNAIADKNTALSYEEMWRFTSLFDFATSVHYDKDLHHNLEKALSNAELLKKVSYDFIIAKAEIESYFCKNYVTGDFQITTDILNKHWMLVDWDAYWNQTSANFIKGCRIANEIVGYTKDDEITKCYQDGQKRHRFKDIFYSSYNGGRVTACFEKYEDALLWNHLGDAHQESDGLYWSEQPAY